MEDKSFVGMSLCFMCMKAKELIMHTRLANTIQREAIYDMEPCDKCKKLIKDNYAIVRASQGKEGLALNGTYAIVTENMVNNFPLKDEKQRERWRKQKIVLIEDKLYDRIITNKGVEA